MQKRFRLKYRRLAAELRKGKLSQNAWARRLGLSKSYLSELANGKHQYPGRNTREALLRGLNLELDELFDPEGRRAPGERERPSGRLLDWSGAGYRLRLDRVGRTREGGERMYDNLRNDIRFAFRGFRRSPLFAAVTLSMLALGVALNLSAFTLVDGILFRSLPLSNPERLVVLDRNRLYSNRDFLEISSNMAHLRQLAAMSPGWGTALIEPGNSTQVTAARVSDNLFQVLGVRFPLGRGFSEEEGLPGTDQVLILSHRLWVDRYGADPDILGRILQVDNESRRVIGVLPANFELLQPKTDIWMTLPRDSNAWYYTSSLNWLVGRLEEGSTKAQAQQELHRVLEGLREKYSLPPNYADHPRISDLLEAEVVNFRPLLLALFGASLTVLLITALNLAHLLLTRLGSRSRELALRQALGAVTGRLRMQLLTETGLFAVLGTLLGALIAPPAIRVFLYLLPADLPRRAAIGVDTRTFIFGALASLLIWFLLGLIPCLFVQVKDLRSALISNLGSRSPTYRRSWSRTALVVLEITLGQALIIGAGLMVHSVWRLNRIDPGFDASHVYTFSVQPSGENFQESKARLHYYARLRELLGNLPGVESVGSTQHLPLSGFSWTADVEFEGRRRDPSSSPPRLGWRVVDEGFFETLRIPLLEGRAFNSEDRLDSQPVAIVNRVAASQYWPDGDPVGKRIRAGNATGNRWATVVGVIGNIRHEGLAVDPQPALYLPYSQRPLVAMSFVLRTAHPEGLVNSVREAVWSADDRVPISEERSFDQIIDESIAQPRMLSFFLGIFSALGLLLGMIGVYGLIAFVVSQRTREFGIRMAIGAQRRQVLAMVIKQGLYLVAAGITLGAALGLLSSRLLGKFLFQIRADDPLTYLAVSLTLAGVIMLASYLPARRATRIDPARALRA